MTARSLPDRWVDDAGWLVQALDPRARLARLVRMSGEDYRTESFLDDRMMARRPEALLCDLDEVLAAGAALPTRQSGWIFHIGHVGSTLISRLLGELGGSFAIREPRSLRDLGVFPREDRAAAAAGLSRLMSRPLEDAPTAVIKATSFVSEFAPLLVKPRDRALFLFAAPRNYVASILAGPNSVTELRALTQSRADRLAAEGIVLEGIEQSDAHRAAAAWLTEMASLQRASMAVGERGRWFDFDRMLGSMVDALSAAATQLELPFATGELKAIADGPLMKRYSKALEYDYSPTLRRDLLADANSRFGADIDRAMDWLEAAAARHEILAAALARAE